MSMTFAFHLFNAQVFIILLGFSLLEMPLQRRRPLARCSCRAGNAGELCKHVATAVLYCVHETDRFGYPNEGVPDAVHAQALRMEREGILVPTSGPQRERNRMHSAARVPAELTELLTHGYISPNYSWNLQGMRWEARDGLFVLTPCGG